MPATSAQRKQIVASLDSEFGLSGLLAEFQWLERHFPAKLRRLVDYAQLRPDVTRIRVSQSRPLLASAAVELLDRRRRQVLPTAIIVLSKNSAAVSREIGPWSVALGPATSFPGSCEPSVEVSLRELLCPSPWVLLGYKPPPVVPSGVGFTAPAGATSIRSVDWGDVSVPGSACGAGKPIHLHNGVAFAEPVIEPWSPAVLVSGSLKARYGQLADREVAAVYISCDNGSGTADGQTGFAAVVYTLKAGLLRVIGVLTPRQPPSPSTPHVPILGHVTIRTDEVITDETWYGPNDGTADPSGRAMTLWKVTGGILRPFRTIIAREPAH